MDSSTITLCRARHVSKDEFDRATTLLSNAEAEAARIIAAAQASAENADADLTGRIAEYEDRLRDTEEAEFRAQLDLATIAQRAAEAVDVLDEAARFRGEVDAVTPWLGKLVEGCLRKIIGKLDAADVLAATLTEAVSELKAKGALSLRVSVADHAEITAMMAAHPDRFSAVTTVTPDADLPSGAIHLDGCGGFSEIGVEAQITALQKKLESLTDAAVGAA
jgi:hypothetical protein